MHGIPTAVAIIGGYTAVAGGHKADRTNGHIPVRNYQHGTEYPLKANVPWLMEAMEREIRAGEGVLIAEQIPGGSDVGGLLDTLRACGWETNDAALKHKSTWITATRGLVTVHLFVGTATLDKERECVLVPPGTAATTAALAFARYQAFTGTAFRINGGATCHALIRSLFARPLKTPGGRGERKRPQPRWHWRPTARPLPSSALIWKGTPAAVRNVAKGGKKWVHHFDVRAQYLAAMSAADLGWEKMEPYGATRFDPDVYGYWKIRIENDPVRPSRPRILSNTRRQGRIAVVTTPLLRYQEELFGRAFIYEVEDSWRCEKSGRYLRPVAEHMRDARRLAEVNGGQNSVVVKAIKQTYTHGVGLFAADGGTIERGDWRDNIIDHANIGLDRKISKIPAGDKLIEVYHDSLWIASEDESPDKLIEILCGDRVGNLKYEDSQSIENYCSTRG